MFFLFDFLLPKITEIYQISYRYQYQVKNIHRYSICLFA